MDNASDNQTASADGAEATALVLGPALLAAMMLVIAAVFTGGEVAPPVALATPAESTISQN